MVGRISVASVSPRSIVFSERFCLSLIFLLPGFLSLGVTLSLTSPLLSRSPSHTPSPVPYRPTPSYPISPIHTTPSHPIPSHPIQFHPIPSHSVTFHPIPSHPIPSYPTTSHPIPPHPIPFYPFPSHFPPGRTRMYFFSS